MTNTWPHDPDEMFVAEHFMVIHVTDRPELPFTPSNIILGEN